MRITLLYTDNIEKPKIGVTEQPLNSPSAFPCPWAMKPLSLQCAHGKHVSMYTCDLHAPKTCHCIATVIEFAPHYGAYIR